MHLCSLVALKAGEMNIFRESCTVLVCYTVLPRPVDLTESVMHSCSYGNLFVSAQATLKQSQSSLAKVRNKEVGAPNWILTGKQAGNWLERKGQKIIYFSTYF